MNTLLAEASVKFGGKVFNTKYGPKSKALAILPSGEEVQLWGDENDAAILDLKSGDSIQLVSIKGKWKLAPTQTQRATPNPTTVNGNGKQPQLMSADQKRLVAEYVIEQSNLLAFCIEQAHKSLVTKFPNQSTPLESEMVRTAGLSLYVATQKRFNL